VLVVVIVIVIGGVTNMRHRRVHAVVVIAIDAGTRTNADSMKRTEHAANVENAMNAVVNAVVSVESRAVNVVNGVVNVSANVIGVDYQHAAFRGRQSRHYQRLRQASVYGQQQPDWPRQSSRQALWVHRYHRLNQLNVAVTVNAMTIYFAFSGERKEVWLLQRR
jgi:hypothetical protein